MTQRSRRTVGAREPAPSKCQAVQRFIEEGREGICPLCDERMPPRNLRGPPRVHCGSPDCAELYNELINIERRPFKDFVAIEREKERVA